MAQTASNVVVAKPKVTGGVWVAPVGTTLPTTEVATLDGDFETPGYITDDGLKRTEDRDTDEVHAWGGDTIFVTLNGVDAKLEVAFAEYLNAVTLQLIYGDDNVTVTPPDIDSGTKTAIVGKLGTLCPKKSWVIDVFSGVAVGRLVFPIVQITETDEVSYKDDELAARGVKATLFPDADGSYFYEYWDDGITT